MIFTRRLFNDDDPLCILIKQLHSKSSLDLHLEAKVNTVMTWTGSLCLHSSTFILRSSFSPVPILTSMYSDLMSSLAAKALRGLRDATCRLVTRTLLLFTTLPGDEVIVMV